jgi:DNA-binding NarL/FixJ family response regulator
VRALSTRERQVVSLLALGHSDKWIAYELGIGEGTVAAAIHTALRKLGVKRSGDLAAVRHALGAAPQTEAGS